MKRPLTIGFVSTMAGSAWGGSEELWSRSALALVKAKVRVSASVAEWSSLHPRVAALREAGITVHVRRSGYPVWRRGLHRFFGGKRSLELTAFEHFLSRDRPHLLVMSSGNPFPPIELAEFCASVGLPFATIGHCNSDGWWVSDENARRFRVALPKARRCYFVSNANRILAEKQIGVELGNAEIIRNPFNVPFAAAPPWPSISAIQELRLACVARLDPNAKGQDILLEALAGPPWSARSWHLSLFGDGLCAETLKRLAERLGLAQRVTFAGQVSDIVEVWKTHHVLVLPSRCEGMPLGLIEAMLCGRPAVVTDVAGHAEIVCDGLTGFLAKAPTVAFFRAALEAMWVRRGELESVGKAAALSIRQKVPGDPIAVFVQKLRVLAREAKPLQANGLFPIYES
jgi:glycosyltransferase involved in cell wall biosynthesis